MRQSPRGAGRQLQLRVAEQNVKAGLGIHPCRMERLRDCPPHHKPHRVLGVALRHSKTSRAPVKPVARAGFGGQGSGCGDSPVPSRCQLQHSHATCI